MTWNVLQSASTAASGSTTTTTTCTYTSNVSSGTKLICYVASYDSGFTVAAQDAAANAMTQVGLISNSTYGCEAAILAMDTPAGDVGAKPVITVTVSPTVYPSVVIQEVSGLAVGNTLAAMVDGAAAGAGFTTSSSNSQPAYSSAAAGEYLVSFAGDGGGPQTMALPGYTLDAHSLNTQDNGNCCPAYKSSTGGAETGTWGFTGTTCPTAILVVAFKLAAAAAKSASYLPRQQAIVTAATR